MKKLFCMVLVGMMLLSTSAYADGMGVIIISSPDISTEPVSLDDIQMGKEAIIEGYGILYPSSFEYVDGLGAYKAGNKSVDSYFDKYCLWYASGNEAEYAVLRMDITNLNTREKNFLENVEVKVVFDDLYEYGGWFYQYNYDNGTINRHAFPNEQNRNYVIDEKDIFPISPMYAGHYCFGCTLPNAVVASKKPLRMEIKIDGNEITYHIRK